jgi:hypothetical protein
MQPAHAETFFLQERLKHPTSRRVEIVVQTIDPRYQLQACIENRPGQVVHASAADPQRPRLPRAAQLRAPVDHFFVLANRPALPTAPD